MTIKEQISAYNNSSRNGSAIKYIVIHDTGVAGQTAKNNADYFGAQNRNASAHYFVDTSNIYHVVNDSRAAWHVGDGSGKYGITNANSIGIEMCPTASGIPEATQNLTIELIKSLQANNGVSDANVVRHYDASRKNCPQFLNLDGNWTAWNAFKAKLTTSSTVTEPETVKEKGDFDGMTTTQKENIIKDMWVQVFGRLPEQGTIDKWVEQINLGVSFVDLYYRMLNSEEARTLFVKEKYHHLLGRDADAAGLKAHLNQMANGWTYYQILHAFLNSDEYKNKNSQ